MAKVGRALGIASLLCAGCASSGQVLPGLKSQPKDWDIKSVDSTWRVGPEMRQSDTGTDANRWTAQSGLEATTHNGHKIGFDYRRRDIDNGMGRNDGHDDGVWLTWSIPLWADSRRPTRKEEELERRIAALEKRLQAGENPPSE